ncbi:hypothetical protein VTO73DRAFT_2895 [Trametes versicolor]
MNSRARDAIAISLRIRESYMHRTTACKGFHRKVRTYSYKAYRNDEQRERFFRHRGRQVRINSSLSSQPDGTLCREGGWPRDREQ